MIQEKIRLNKWSKLEYRDPEKFLIKVNKLDNRAAYSNLPYKVRSLKTKKLRKHHERLLASIFCYGIGKVVINKNVYISDLEDEDFDCIAKWEDGGIQRYTPIQFKEVVPDRINLKSTLEETIKKLKKFSDFKDLVVAIYVNKRQKLDFSKINLPKLQISELWIFGAINPYKSEWFLYGNLLDKSNCNYYNFTYPVK